MQEIEIEFKNLLTKEEFDRLLHYYPFPKEGETQINYYFETKDRRLQKHKAALRIRKKNEQYRLTLKVTVDEGVLETHDVINEKVAKSWLNGRIIPQPNIGKELQMLGINFDDLMYYGYLTTVRRELRINNLLLVLDMSTYNNHKDYEFELEANSKEAGLKAFHSILKQHQISNRKTKTKIERFFSTYDEKFRK